MSKIFLVLIILIINISLNAQTYNWVRTNSINVETNPSLAIFPSSSDVSGNLITGSLLTNKLNYGSNYYGNVIIKKYSNSGTEILSKILAGKVLINGVQTDGSGSIYVFGTFMDTLIIEPGNFILNTSSGFNLNDYIIKFSSSGTFVWKKNITAVYGGFTQITALRVKGNFIYAGILDFNLGSLKKYDLNGNEAASFVQSPVRQLSGIDVDASGNIFTAGSCESGNIQFSNLNVNCPYVYGLYFTKYNSSFTAQWVKLVEDVTFEDPKVMCDNDGNAFVSGSLNTAFVFDTIHTQGPSWVYDFYLAKINPAGSYLWVREVPNVLGGDATIGDANYLAVDDQNSAYITGLQRGTINWGNFTTTGNNDILVLKYSSSGNLLWGKTSGGVGLDRGHSVCADNTGNIFVTGNFQNSFQFDTIPVSATSQLSSFAAKLSNPPLGIVSYNNNQPSQYSIKSYPNPFNPVTILKTEIPQSRLVKLTVYDILGKEISVLTNEVLKPGTYEIEWNAESIPSGIYFARLDAGEFSKTIKLMLVK